MERVQQKVVRGNSRIPAPPVFISECELLGDGGKEDFVKAAFEELKKSLGEKGAIEYLLVELWGFDKNKKVEGTDTFYEVREQEHRTRLSGKIVNGKRYEGFERLDDAWILRGYPSDEAKVAARQDASYVQEIRQLSRTKGVS